MGVSAPDRKAKAGGHQAPSGKHIFHEPPFHRQLLRKTKTDPTTRTSATRSNVLYAP